MAPILRVFTFPVTARGRLASEQPSTGAGILQVGRLLLGGRRTLIQLRNQQINLASVGIKWHVDRQRLLLLLGDTVTCNVTNTPLTPILALLTPNGFV